MVFMLLSRWFGYGYGQRAIDILPSHMCNDKEDDDAKHVIEVDPICYGSDEMV